MWKETRYFYYLLEGKKVKHIINEGQKKTVFLTG
jgi:hypothetical protein